MATAVKFWIEDPRELFKNWKFRFGKDVSLEEKINNISKIHLASSVVVMLVNRKVGLIVLVVGLVATIIFYYSYRAAQKKKAGYQEYYSENIENIESPYLTGINMYNKPLHKPSANQAKTCSKYPCYTAIQGVTKTGVSDCGLKNVNGPCFTPKLGNNPRTYIPPYIPPPIASDVWRYPSYSPVNYAPTSDITEQSLDLVTNPLKDPKHLGLNVINKRNKNKTEGYVDMIPVPNLSQVPETPDQMLARMNGADAVAQNSGAAYEALSDPVSDQMVSDEGIINDPRIPKNVFHATRKLKSQDRLKRECSCGCGEDCKCPEECSCGCAVIDILMEPTPTWIYTPEELNQPQVRPYVQTIQPDAAWEMAWDGVPINSSLGISYAPQIPPTFRDQVLNNDGYHPFYTAVSPQFVRDDGLAPGRKVEMPTRTAWSAKGNDLEAADGTVDYRKFDPYSDVYDPRLSGHGDVYRSYADVNLGQVDYYYSDINSLRTPNFTIRNKVDHVMFKNPMDGDSPVYIREEYASDKSLNEIKEQVEDQATADEVFHREDMMSLLMRKRNSELYQLRYAPLKQQNNAAKIFV